MSRTIRIGVISDTHKLLRPEASAALKGVEHIIHAGDIGSLKLIEELRTIAPVTAVRGNTDEGAWARRVPEDKILVLGAVRVYVIHDLDDMALNPNEEGFAAVIFGHSHEPENDVRNEVLFFNPGSAGPRRFHLPIALGFLTIRGRSVSGEILMLRP
jgi:putative phosphoesterase